MNVDLEPASQSPLMKTDDIVMSMPNQPPTIFLPSINGIDRTFQAICVEYGIVKSKSFESRYMD